eukprot:3786366-Pleurochrysis_carterae.AAC.2
MDLSSSRAPGFPRTRVHRACVSSAREHAVWSAVSIAGDDVGLVLHVHRVSVWRRGGRVHPDRQLARCVSAQSALSLSRAYRAIRHAKFDEKSFGGGGALW